MTLNLFQELARRAIYEPGRELRNTEPPTMVETGVRELSIRFLPDHRTFAAIADDGLVVEMGFLEPGGDEEAMLGQLESRLREYRLNSGMLKVI